jgi:DNA-directed RNA polymerase specialized sigma24 family protein
MTDIYVEISKLTEKFRTMAYGITTDENRVNEAVQELMLYFLQANPEVIKKIYTNDGIKGILKYGAVALRRSLTSKRSNFYYKIDKYYNHIDSSSSNITYESDFVISHKNLYNIANENEDFDHTKTLHQLELIDVELDKLKWYDRELFKLYYYDKNTYNSLAEKTKISRNSLFTTIDKVRTIIKKKLNEDV